MSVMYELHIDREFSFECAKEAEDYLEEISQTIYEFEQEDRPARGRMTIKVFGRIQVNYE